MDFKFTLNLNISDILTFNELLTINSIGFALIVLSLKSRLTYLISPNYHNDQYIQRSTKLAIFSQVKMCIN